MSRTITAPGIYLDFDIKAYFADPCPAPSLSQSIAKIILDQSPAHARVAHPRLGTVYDNSEDYEASRVIGNAIHAILLKRGKKLVVGRYKDWRKKEAQQFKEEAYESGHEPILEKHYERAVFACRSIEEQFNSIEGRKPLTGGEAEVVIAWEEDGYWFRSMIDYDYEHRIIEDLKTSGASMAPSAIPMQMSEWGWQCQAAMIERGLNKLDPDNSGRRRFRFIGIENREPYGLTVNELSESVLTIGRQMIDMAIRKWKACLRSGVWPCYPIETNFPELPGFKQIAWEEKFRQLREEYDAEGI